MRAHQVAPMKRRQAVTSEQLGKPSINRSVPAASASAPTRGGRL